MGPPGEPEPGQERIPEAGPGAFGLPYVPEPTPLAGDVAACYADPTLAAQTIGWKATRDLDAMCADAWRWQTANPNGYAR